MRLVFIYGQAAAGKLTVGRELAQLTGLPLFHNHLVVDAVAAVFPFGSEGFVRLREQMWMSVLEEAVRDGRDLIFTFAPEASVPADFPDRVRRLVEAAGGEVVFVRLDVPVAIQEDRIDAASRAEFGKLRSLELLRDLRDQFDACLEAMPEAHLVIDTAHVPPAEAAHRIADRLAGR